jgi:hypothetical protein
MAGISFEPAEIIFEAPPLPRFMHRAASSEPLTVPQKLVWNRRWWSSGAISSRRPKIEMPALLTQVSMRPKRSMACQPGWRAGDARLLLGICRVCGFAARASNSVSSMCGCSKTV